MSVGMPHNNSSKLLHFAEVNHKFATGALHERERNRSVGNRPSQRPIHLTSLKM